MTELGTRDGARSPHVPTLLTFLIADVRGYTRFTLEHGDEAAARLAGKFVGIARQLTVTRGGELIELRGDEALAVFPSARQALHAALDLQRRFVQEIDDDPALPLRVGIGLDAGEAIPVEGGYRGGALNLAARLCSIAGAGEVFCSETVIGLARKTEGITFVDRGEVMRTRRLWPRSATAWMVFPWPSSLLPLASSSSRHRLCSNGYRADSRS